MMPWLHDAVNVAAGPVPVNAAVIEVKVSASW
jgi:hypothetical protein